MPAWLTSTIELAVGIGCPGCAVATWRVRGLRIFAVLFAIGGALAAGHAAWALLRR
jgi:hypothetical protein